MNTRFTEPVATAAGVAYLQKPTTLEALELVGRQSIIAGMAAATAALTTIRKE